MPEKKQGWTRPGAIDPNAHAVIDTEEGRKGTAADRPVLVVAPDRNIAGAVVEDGRVPNSDGIAAVELRDNRSPAEIEADLDRTRERLSLTLDELSERLSPRDLARRGGRRIKAQFVDEQTGAVRRGPAAAALGTVAAVVAALVGVQKVRGSRG
jgi:Protein of unknown function (DUF3618)